MAAKTNTTTKPVAKKAAPKKTAASSKLQHNVDGYPGLARTGTSQVSGTTVNLWFNAESKRATDKGPWTLECEDHGKELVVASRREARDQRANITSWCSGCKADAKRSSKAA